MKSQSLLLSLAPALLLLSACNESQGYGSSQYDTGYIGTNDYKIIPHQFTPGANYRIQLTSRTGDADLGILTNDGEYVVYSDENGAAVDAITFTAQDAHYDIEIYGYQSSEYRLMISEIPYYAVGLNTAADGVEFNIDVDAFSGVLYSELASQSVAVSHNYDQLTIEPVLDQDWLNVVPTGTFDNHNISLEINILETSNPSVHNLAVIRLTAKDDHNKISVFRDIEVLYNMVDR